MSSELVLAYDRTSDDPSILSTGASWADRLGATLTVLHVVTDQQAERYREDGRSEGPYLDVILDQLRDEIRAELIGAVGAERADAIHVMTVKGDPEELVPAKAAELGAEALLIGVRSRSRVAKLVFGSVAQTIILLSPCPVLCLPSQHKAG